MYIICMHLFKYIYIYIKLNSNIETKIKSNYIIRIMKRLFFLILSHPNPCFMLTVIVHSILRIFN